MPFALFGETAMSSSSHISAQVAQPRNEETMNWVAQLSRIAVGDQIALASFYDSTNSRVFSLILRILANHSNSEEVLLDVYLQVWRQAANYRIERGTPLVWLMTIARSRALDRLRSGRQERQCNQSLDLARELRSFETLPDRSAINNEHQQMIRKALRTLSIEQRQALELAYFSGLSQSEIAEKIGKPLGTVKTRLRLGMIKLKNVLTPQLNGN
jgi:RNA polymerase sigma-70 factor, ECF subfamily